MDSAEFCRLHEVAQQNMVAKGKVMPGIMVDSTRSVERCCFWCGDPVDVLLFGSLNKKQREALRQSFGDNADADLKIVTDREPCAECQEVMDRGVCLMEATREEEETVPTGRYWVLTEKAIRALVNLPGMADSIISKKRALIGKDVARKIGLYDCDGRLN